jgi:molecular chaperone DnaK
LTDPIVGIDLGTSNTAVAYADATGTARVLADDDGVKIHPSVVSFHPNGGVVVGAAAKQRKVIDPKNTIYSVKRLIGRRFDAKEVDIARQRSPFAIEQGPNQQPLVVTRAGKYAVPEISAIVLDHARNVAASALDVEVNRAVVTVPASFNDAQRSATATAGAIANLSVVRVINEPTAAALAYGHTRGLHEVIAVYDFGGGTFDITILRLEDQIFEVLGTSGDTFLGGDDLDERIVDRMVEKFLAENRVDLRTNEMAMMRLRAVAEQTKIELSRRMKASIRVDEIAYGANGKALDLQIEITRDEFVFQIGDIVDRTFPVCEEALRYAQLDTRAIDDIVLVGGTTKIPFVRDRVTQFFGKAPRTDVNPEEAVALGAALQAHALETALGARSPSSTVETMEPPPDFDEVIDELTLEQPTRNPYGEETTTESAKRTTAGYSEVMRAAEAPTRVGERPVTRGDHHDRLEARPPAGQAIGRITKPGAAPAVPPPKSPPPAVPAKTMVGTASGPTKTAKPMEAVRPPAPPPTPPPVVPAAAPQAPTLMLEPSPASTAKGFAPPPPQTYPVMQSPIVIDVTPRGLGITTVAGFCEELIGRNSQVPCETRKIFVTGRDLQDTVRIVVVQGESRRLEANMVLGDLTLSELPRRPRGETSIEVTFHIDASGILQVRARDAHTGREQRASLDLAGAMPEAEVAASRERVASLRR